MNADFDQRLSSSLMLAICPFATKYGLVEE